MEYEVKFEVFDKKLKVNVKADSEIDALEYVRNAIKVHSITPAQAQTKASNSEKLPPTGGTTDEWYKYFRDMLGGLDKKR